ncbi:MAG: hypothetical protein DCC58_13475 [Chloroflexi bacterium]|nr:MAG: hypothetical protein DCC58_13475 [Chloroflexota bacterium]
MTTYTPHGLLWTPGHHARSWNEPVGGVGATDPRRIGAGFRLLAPRRFVALFAELALPNGAVLADRRAFNAAGRTWASVHTSRRILIEWEGHGARLTLLVHSAGPQTLGFELHVAGATARWRLDGPLPADAVALVDGARLGLGEHSQEVRASSIAWFALDGVPPVWTADDMAREDERFWSNAPRLSGDWPEEWARGWEYDLETTRLMVQPPGGIYRGPWPSWMAEWPRTVAAEGSLDMARLAIADPHTATAALETLWTQAPAPNLPCVFRDGQPNMVARMLPALEAYLEWWQRERVVDGYLSYACTWESGEDDNPRLDPLGTGGGAILGQNRPPELPATLASSARLVALMWRQVGGAPERERRWQETWHSYRDLLNREYWDPTHQRYRDLDPRTGGFLEPSGAAYWQTDSIRVSPLSLTPALTLLDQGYHAGLARQLAECDAPPWNWWPSWSGTVLAAASALGQHAFAAGFAQRLVARVWAEIDAPDASTEVTGRPLPGVSREYWPGPGHERRFHDGYGWGAETATFFLRHIAGVQPNLGRIELRPMLPASLNIVGRRYGIGPLTVAGMRGELVLEPGERATEVTYQRASGSERRWSLPHGASASIPVEPA